MTSLRGFDTPICFAAAVVCPDITHLTRFDGELAKFVRVPPRVLKDSLKIEFVTCMIHRSEEHTSELQSRLHLVCRLLLEKKKNTSATASTDTLQTDC